MRPSLPPSLDAREPEPATDDLSTAALLRRIKKLEARVAKIDGDPALMIRNPHRCKMVYDAETRTKFFLPGCMGGAVNEMNGCTCPARINPATFDPRKG